MQASLQNSLINELNLRVISEISGYFFNAPSMQNDFFALLLNWFVSIQDSSIFNINSIFMVEEQDINLLEELNSISKIHFLHREDIDAIMTDFT